MDFQTLRDAVRRRPFEPFTLRMNDGREFYIPHPECIAVSPAVVFVFEMHTNAGIFLEPALIASLQSSNRPPQPTAEPKTGDGT
ncbi:MAG: hypothetical protein L0Z62_23915 [Gemmataceae bacterium]|nr:hypothetical protein [Gemmataceae bacterium]